MPIFEYQCNACEIRFEVLQRTNKVNKSLKCPHLWKTRYEKTFLSIRSDGYPEGIRNDYGN